MAFDPVTAAGGQWLNGYGNAPMLAAQYLAGGGGAGAVPWGRIGSSAAGAGAATLPAEAAASAGLLGKFASMKTLPRLGAGFAAGQLGKSASDAAGGPSWLGSGLAGAGVGAAIGAPFGGIGAVPGAVVGGIAGLGGGILADALGIDIPGISGGGGQDGPDFKTQNKKLKKAINDLAPQLSAADAASVAAARRIARTLPADQRAAYLSQTLTALPGLIAQNAQTRQGLMDQLSIQAAAGQMMAQLGGQSVASGQAQHDSLMSLAGQVNPAMRPLLEYDANNRLYNSQQMANAFTGSILAAPVANAMQNQISQLAQLNQQQQAQGGGGSQSFMSLLGGGG